MSIFKGSSVYLASGWFTPEASKDVDELEKILDSKGFDVFSPRREFVCPPTATKEVQEATFKGNIKHIHGANWVLVNTRDKDMGTIFEAGVAYENGAKIVYYCKGLPEGAMFNLMLSRSGIKVCTSPEQLEDYLDRCLEAEDALYEPYGGTIE